MAEKKSAETISNQNPDQLPSLAIIGQYVKDLSFENPHAPQSLVPGKEAPKVDIAINLEAKEVQEGTFEVTLVLTANSTSAENNKLFVAEIKYAGLFALKNVPDEHKEQILLIDCPTILFPFARRIMADVTRDGGFQALMIDPIDFRMVFAQRKAEGKSETKN